MNFLNKLPLLVLIPAALFTATTGDVEITVTVPSSVAGNGSSSSSSSSSSSTQTEVIEIGSFFTPNQDSDALTPEQQKLRELNHPLFSAEEAFPILKKNSNLFKKVPIDELIIAHLTIPSSNPKHHISVSFSQAQTEGFSLIPHDQNNKSFKVRFFLGDAAKKPQDQKLIEIKAKTQYRLSEIQNKTLFLKIEKSDLKDQKTIDFSHYFLPLEVIYQTP